MFPLGVCRAQVGVPGPLTKRHMNDTLLPTSATSQRFPQGTRDTPGFLPTRSHSRGTGFLTVSPPITWLLTVLTPLVAIFHKGVHMCLNYRHNIIPSK